MRIALTEDRIAAERARHRDLGRHHVLWDTTCRGLGVRLRGESATYMVRGRHDGKPVWLSIGPVDGLRLADARKAAQTHLGEWARGNDPRAKRRVDRERARRPRFTLADAWKLYEAHADTRRKKPISRTNDRSLYTLHLAPALGSLRIPEELTSARIGTWYVDLAESFPTTANRARALLSTILARGARDHLVAAGNPCRDVRPTPEAPRTRRLSPAELVALGRALRELAAEPGADRLGLAAVELTLLSGMRRGEVLSLTWSMLEEPTVAALPDSKTGPKRVPLGAAARALLAALREQAPTGQTLVFPDRHGRRRRNLDRVWEDVRTAIGATDLHLHDLRHEWVSQGIAAGLSLVVLGRVVGHTSQFMTDRYAHLEDAAAVEAADRVAARLAAILEHKRPAAVVPLRSGA